MAWVNRERTILGDLTTVFTPPAPCTVAVGQCSTCDVAWMGQTCGPDGVADNAQCWPTTTEGAKSPGTPMFGWGFYSPGIECPAGYTTACTAVSGGPSQWKVQFKMEPEETFVGCCPEGFKCDNLSGQTCRWVAKSTQFATVSCQSGKSNDFGYSTLPNEHRKEVNVYAPMIQLAFKSSDLPESTTTTSSSSSASTTSSSATNSGPTTTVIPGSGPGSDPNSNPKSDSITDSNSSSSSTLSTGAIAGIAVAAGVLFLLILAAAIFVWRRRRAQAAAYADSQIPDNISQPPAYSPGAAGGVVPGAAMAPGGAQTDVKHFYSGAPVTTSVVEMGQGHERVEAPGEGYGPSEMFAGQQQQMQHVPSMAGAVPAAAQVPPNAAGVYYNPANGPVEMPAQRYS